MKQETIPNQYDGPRAPVKKLQGGQISLDYVNSDNAAEIDSGIRECIKGLRLSILAMGMGLAKLKAKGLYIDLNYHSMNDYLEALCDEMQVERSTAHNWLYIGEAYIKYRRDLDRIEFTDADGPTKLPYVDRALELYEKREVFRNIKDMTLQKFKEWSRAIPINNDNNYKSVRIKGDSVVVGKSPIITFAEEISPKDRKFYEKLIIEGAQAIEQKEFTRLYRFYDESEARVFDRIYHRELKRLRSKK